MKSCRGLFLVGLVWTSALGPVCLAKGAGKTTVTTYVVTTQEERESTRFTLTEWLRIKERMKMMDVWLAMFSEPEKSRFRPELGLAYSKASGLSALSGSALQDPDTAAPMPAAGSFSAQTGRISLWLTNIISSSFGIRTLNVDLGCEAYLQQATASYKDLAALNADAASASPLPAVLPSVTKDFSRYGSLDLRIFGKNIQDSSFVLKVGEFSASKEISSNLTATGRHTFSGQMLGAGLQLYILRWLGFEANGHRFASRQAADGLAMHGESYEAGLYLEISLFRFGGGIFADQWDYKLNGTRQLSEKNAGRYLGFTLNL